MAYKKLQDIVNNVLTELGLVAGSAVQTYTEPQVQLAVNRMFKYLVNKNEWPHLISWEQFTLSGVGGLTAQNFTGIKSATDILQVESERGHPIIASGLGRDHLFASGNRAEYFAPLPWTHPEADTKLIRFWPLDATGTVNIRAYFRPDDFISGDDIVPFDPNIIELGAAWYVLQGDGMNAANAEKVRVMFDLNYQDVVGRINKLEIGHGVNTPNGTFSIRQ